MEEPKLKTSTVKYDYQNNNNNLFFTKLRQIEKDKKNHDKKHDRIKHTIN